MSRTSSSSFQPRRGWLFRAMHVAVPLCLIAVILWSVDISDVTARLASVAPVWVACAVVAVTAQVVLCAMRWRLTAERLGADLSPGRAVSEYYLSGAINMTLPGGVVGDAMRAVRTRGTAGLAVAAQAVVIERLAGQIALGATLLVGLLISGRPQLQIAGLAMALIAVALWASKPFLMRTLLPRRLSEAVHLPSFAAAIRRSWFERGAATAQITLSVLIVAANLAAFAFASLATGTAIAFSDALFAIPLILAAMLIPFSVAGWGYREGAAAAIFPLIGSSSAAGVTASVVFGAIILLANLPGIVVLFFRKQTPTPTSPAPRS